MTSPTKEDVVPQTVDRKMVRSWTEELEAVDERLSVHFARSEVRERAQDYLRGLLSETERKNGWQLAEVAGNATPYGIQHLLGRANWDAEAVRDELREYVGEHLSGEESVLIVDETGFIKKGDKSVGVKRQYTGTAGKRENCQVGVFLAYASERGQGFIDRELYLPEEWASDEHRRERAGVPEEVGMLLEERGQPYVLAVSGKAYVWAGLHQQRIGEVLEVVREGGLVPEDAAEAGFKRLSAGNGSKGQRLYDWARLPLNPPMQEGFQRWLLVRRSIEDPQELSAYTVFAPEGATLEELAKAAGSRWRVEIGFEEAKGEVGLAHYEVRSWHGWYRHITLALFAHALLATIRSAGLEVQKK